MSRPVLLNNVDHQDLRVAVGHGPGLGEDVMTALSFAGEFRALQAYYPIVFQKDALGSFHPLALLGLQPGQNLFLRDGRWDAHYVPLAIARQPFLIGNSAEGEPMLHIDLDHPRVGHGEPLFLEHGGTTPLLEQVTSLMRALYEGVAGNGAFVEALLSHALLEPFVLEVKLPGREALRLAGYYTIAEERLRALDGQALQALATSGYLEPVYMALASLSHLRDLIGRVEASDD
jgi:hypothetical protein